jgi:hypothetical protein
METLPPDVLEALKRGNQIEAIKLLRKAKGMGLSEAKGRVDDYLLSVAGTPAPSHSVVDSRLSPGEVPRRNAAAAVVVAIILGAIAIWILSRLA